MPDYKEMYLIMARAAADAVDVLIAAQQGVRGKKVPVAPFCPVARKLPNERER